MLYFFIFFNKNIDKLLLYDYYIYHQFGLGELDASITLANPFLFFLLELSSGGAVLFCNKKDIVS